MAFPTDRKNQLGAALDDVQRQAGRLKAYLEQSNVQMAAGNVSATLVLNIGNAITEAYAAFDNAESLPGMGQYAQDQLGNPALDVVAEFQEMKRECDEALQWIDNNLPKNGGGFLRIQTMTYSLGALDVSWSTFTPAETAGFRSVLGELIATID